MTTNQTPLEKCIEEITDLGEARVFDNARFGKLYLRENKRIGMEAAYIRQVSAPEGQELPLVEQTRIITPTNAMRVYFAGPRTRRITIEDLRAKLALEKTLLEHPNAGEPSPQANTTETFDYGAGMLGEEYSKEREQAAIAFITNYWTEEQLTPEYQQSQLEICVEEIMRTNNPLGKPEFSNEQKHLLNGHYVTTLIRRTANNGMRRNGESAAIYAREFVHPLHTTRSLIRNDSASQADQRIPPHETATIILPEREINVGFYGGHNPTHRRMRTIMSDLHSINRAIALTRTQLGNEGTPNKREQAGIVNFDSLSARNYDQVLEREQTVITFIKNLSQLGA